MGKVTPTMMMTIMTKMMATMMMKNMMMKMMIKMMIQMMKIMLKTMMLMCDRVYLPLQAGTTIMSGAVSNVLEGEGGRGGQLRSMQYQDISLGDIKICNNEK